MSRDRYAETLEALNSATYSLTFVQQGIEKAFMAVPEGTTEAEIAELVADARELEEGLQKLRTRVRELGAIGEKP